MKRYKLVNNKSTENNLSGGMSKKIFRNSIDNYFPITHDDLFGGTDVKSLKILNKFYYSVSKIRPYEIVEENIDSIELVFNIQATVYNSTDTQSIKEFNIKLGIENLKIFNPRKYSQDKWKGSQ